jgi:hypothetical protein
MPFDLIQLSPSLINKVNSLLKEQELNYWYLNYSWESDTKGTEFQNIVNLEIELSQAAKSNRISCEQVLKIARWGGHPMQEKIRCKKDIDLILYENGTLSAWIREDPAEGLRQIRPQVNYIGPTYMTKILRFSLPSEFGALDTRITRVFGRGDPKHSYIHLLDLEAEDKGWKWFIRYPQPYWPDEYSKFIFILRYIVQNLNERGIKCPHPQTLYDFNLRTPGIWECADVEMALFSFASERIYPKLTKESGG